VQSGGISPVIWRTGVVSSLQSVLLVVALVIGTPALASCELSSARVNNTLVKVGDSDRRVISAKPDRTVRLTTSAGGSAGTRYDFYQRGLTIQIYVLAGRVSRVCRIRE
jgi:hypothetical protein